MNKLFLKYALIIVIILPSLCFAQNYQTGDIIFQTSKSAQSMVIQKATHSPYSHMGMIVNMKGQYFVLEAIQPVQYTPLQQWIKRGVQHGYVVKRYQKSLNLVQQQKLVKQAEKYLGRPYDIYFEWSDDAIYCSEIVWKAYQDGLGIQLAPLKKLSSFDLSDAKVKALMKQRYGLQIPLQETVISPKDIFESQQLLIVK